jgi:hypothetical protein
MIIRPTDINVVHVHDDDQFFTIVESYRKYDTIEPVYTIIQEDAHGSPIVVHSNKSGSSVNEYFKHDIVTFFNKEEV